MLGFVQSLFGPGANPIGVDFGTTCLRLAQVEKVAEGEYRLVAAASAEVPVSLANDGPGRLAFFTQTVRDLLSHGSFHGKRAVLSLSATSMHIRHLRLAKMSPDDLQKSLAEVSTKELGIEAEKILQRHLVAGPVGIDAEPQEEIILMAARREPVDQLLAAASKARLDVIGLNIEATAIVNCFAHVYRRRIDSDVTSCYVDIGNRATRIVIADGSHMMFSRVIPLGGEHFDQAVADALGISRDDARLLRIKTCRPSAEREEQKETSDRSMADAAMSLVPPDPIDGGSLRSGGVALLEAPRTVASGDPNQQVERVEAACRQPLSDLIDAITRCRSTHDASFPAHQVDRLIFVGGESRQPIFCREIADAVELPGQLGDPMVRMGRISNVGIESGIDRRLPQPSWAISIGLSMGPAANSAAAPR